MPSGAQYLERGVGSDEGGAVSLRRCGIFKAVRFL